MSNIVNPDYSEVVAPLTEGRHAFEIVSFEARMSRQEKPYINWKLSILGGGHIVYYSTPISGKGAGMFKHLIHASGDTAYESGPYDLEDLVGKKIVCEIFREKYINSFGQEKTIFKVKDVSPYSIMDTSQRSDTDLPF